MEKKPVHNVREYSRPDFLQESYKLRKGERPKTIDLHRAMFIRRACQVQDDREQMVGQTLLDAKVTAFVIDAYTLAPTRAMNTDIEHLQAFDEFKEKVDLLFGYLNHNSTPSCVRRAVIDRYKGKGFILETGRKGRRKKVVPTEYTMRMLYNLFRNTLLMFHYFNTVKGAQETSAALEKSREYSSPFIYRLSGYKRPVKLAELLDKGHVVTTFKKSGLVNRVYQGRPLYDAIHAWVEDGSEIQNMLIRRSDDKHRREYLYIVANRLQKNEQLPQHLRDGLVHLSVRAIDLEIRQRPTTKIRADLKGLIRTAHKHLGKGLTPETMRAVATSDIRRKRGGSGDSTGTQRSGESGSSGSSIDMKGSLGDRQSNVRLRVQLEERKAQSAQLKSELKMANQTIVALREQMAAKDNRIDNLEAQITEQAKRHEAQIAEIKALLLTQSQSREEGAISKE